MRIRRVVVCLMLVVAGLAGGVGHAATPVILVTGPLLPPGGFSERGMHPVFTSCSFPTFQSPTATTIVVFEIRLATHDGIFQIHNSCGTYEETFGLGECQRDFTFGFWECWHVRPDGFHVQAVFSYIDGRPHVNAAEYVPDLSRFWSVDGYVAAAVE